MAIERPQRNFLYTLIFLHVRTEINFWNTATNQKKILNSGQEQFEMRANAE